VFELPGLSTQSYRWKPNFNIEEFHYWTKSMWQISQFKRAILTLAVPFMLFAGVSDANAAEITTPKMKWQGGQLAAICDDPAGICYTVEMPKHMSNVEGIYPAPIIRDARASWVARSKYELFVCAVVLNSPRVACTKINSNPFPAAYADLRMKYSPSGKTRISVAGRGTAAGHALLIAAETGINLQYAHAVGHLQRTIDALTLIDAPFTGRMRVYDPRTPGDPPEEGCKWQNGGWMCPGPKPYDDCIPVAGPKWFCRIASEIPEPEPEADPE
jgi:hypothetical protein